MLPTLYHPTGLAVDAKANLYVADSGNFRIVEIGPQGQLIAHFGDADLRPGPAAPPTTEGQEPIGPLSLAVAANGTVYVADSLNSYIRVFSSQHHLVGDWPISLPDARVLQLAVAIGARGNVIVAIAAQVNCTVPEGPSYCAGYYIVQRRSPAGAILNQFHSPIAPSGMEASPPVISQIATAVDPQGNIFVATSGTIACYKSCPSFHYLIKHSPDGKVLAKGGGENLAMSANWPALALGGRGNLFLADDFNHRIEKRAPSGNVMARWSFGSLSPKLLTGPSGVAVDRAGSIYFSDPGSGRILKLSSSGKLLAQWGAGGSAPDRFWFPGSIALDNGGHLWVDDAGNSRVQMLGNDGRFHVQFTVARSGPGMALDRAGNVYIGQQLGQSVYISKFSPSGRLLRRWGGLHLAELPGGIAVASNGDIFVAAVFYFGNDPKTFGLDGENILRLDSQGRQLGLFHVHAGETGSGIAVDAQGNGYIAYGTTPHVEKRSRDGVLLASWGVPNPTAVFPGPAGITLDAAANIYLTNRAQSVIEELGPNGALLRTWGFRGSYPSQFHHPGGIAVDPGGMIYVADTDNQRIQELP